MASSAVIGWRILFLLLGCTLVTALVYTVATDGSPFRQQILSPLMVVTVIDLYISIVALATWISYKEANWITSTIWIVFLVCFSGITTSAYILWQLWQLSSQESFDDIMYHVLIRNPNKVGMEQHRKQSNVMIAKIVFIVLSCLMAVNLVYFFSAAPFRIEFFTPSWMVTTLIDFYIDATVLSTWMFYKEESWLSAFFWIVLLLSFGSISTCPFIVKELFKLKSGDPPRLILLKPSHRSKEGYEQIIQ
ncbi:uncharacterized protein LOC101218608 [Cucumis sativus]|uniref:Uncharacterized protein n=1 Tax=Cucumis sativus TaxID=3659 RepID=A0A0A0KB83_CUCSA|nr:uncharacterized protein LOC101218608 [Cucumis sativus]KGN46099.1 hypothetical protein Csa_005097 [Cucumis sativus]